MKFSQMPYRRIDLADTQRKAGELTRALQSAPSFDDAKAAFDGWQQLSSHLETAMALAHTRHTVDTTDEFYDKEKEFYDENTPLLQQLDQNFTQAMLESPYRARFQELLGPLYFQNAEIAQRTFRPEIIPGLQEENRATTEYVKLIASGEIEFQGKTRTLPEMTPFMQSPDREVRKAAWNAHGAFLQQNGEALDRIYHDLVGIRTGIAKGLGHSGFIPLGYDRMTRNCYGEEDILGFRKGVVEHIVPLVTRLKQEQAERLGVPFPMTYADDALTFPTGNAKPTGTPDQILAHGQRMYHELSPETAEFIDFMMENELFDVLSRKGKASGGYCTTLPDYKSPFIFANFNGTAGDVEVITHEAGHAFADYQARDIYPMENRRANYESCEIHSMSMEFFAWPWCDGFFGADTPKFHYQHLAGALTFLPYGTMVDHFQHEMYRSPHMTPAERHRLWAGLEQTYRPWISDSETTFYKDGRYWQRQLHIYEMPFYYIDYCLAQTVALQFWAAIQADRDDAWTRYLRLVGKAGTLPFTGLVEAGGMASPFRAETLKEVADTAMAWLDNAPRGPLR